MRMSPACRSKEMADRLPSVSPVVAELVHHLAVLTGSGCHGKIGPLIGIIVVIVKLFGSIVITNISPTF